MFLYSNIHIGRRFWRFLGLQYLYWLKILSWNIHFDWRFCTRVFILAQDLVLEYSFDWRFCPTLSVWLNILYKSIHIDWSFRTGMSILTEDVVLKYPCWLEILKILVPLEYHSPSTSNTTNTSTPPPPPPSTALYQPPPVQAISATPLKACSPYSCARPPCRSVV